MLRLIFKLSALNIDTLIKIMLLKIQTQFNAVRVIKSPPSQKIVPFVKNAYIYFDDFYFF
ncbi:hypothetical protein CDG60_13425 [Acinetobacter chinensis]|uniref:Uncharacterized protein n=1 Tax=Acinetobacter chinensis TaxID=2004650 RepID=A0A3B7LYJ8_9GAMM|nr:hypothetical protein CDG60_13425 [Acinetobacter chinensis]